MAPTLLDQTCGLCGTFNHIDKDDYHLRSNDDVVTIDEFAKEWLVPDLSVDKCGTESVVSSIDYCDIYLQNKNWTQLQCSVLKDPAGPFADCHSEISYTKYYEKCLQDGCRCEGCLCNVISGYATACAEKDVDVNGWRNHVSRCEESKIQIAVSLPMLSSFHLNGHTLGFHSTDSKVRTTLCSIINSSRWKDCSIAFIWMVTH